MVSNVILRRNQINASNITQKGGLTCLITYDSGKKLYEAIDSNGKVFRSTSKLVAVQYAIDNAENEGLICLFGFDMPEDVELAHNVIVQVINNGTIEYYGTYFDYKVAETQQIMMRFHATSEMSKPILEWVDYLGNPVAWITAHHLSNDGLTTHDHISIETNNGVTKGDLFTRFEIGYGSVKPIVRFNSCSIDFTNSGTSTLDIRNSAVSATLREMVDADRAYIYTITNHELRLGANGASSKIVIKPDGYVGINDDTPNSQLEIKGSLSIASLIVTTGTTTLDGTHCYVRGNAVDGAITINLPSATGLTGRTYIIKKIDASANTVTIDPNSTQTIDGQETYVLSAQWQHVQIICTGGNWEIIGAT